MEKAGSNDSESSSEVRLNAESDDSQNIEHLIARCRVGDLEAFDELVAKYQQFVFRVIYQHLGNKEDVEDVAQEVFIRVFRSIKSFRGDSSIETWLYKIALNRIRSYVRSKGSVFKFFLQQRKREGYKEDVSTFETMVGHQREALDPGIAFEDQMMIAEVINAVRGLPIMYREILIMRDIDGLSYEEIANVVGISVGTVKSRLNRARELVRNRVRI